MNREVKLSFSQQRPLVESWLYISLYTLFCGLLDRFPAYPCHCLSDPILRAASHHPHSQCPKAPFTLSPQLLFPEHRRFAETFIQLQRPVKSSCYRLEGRGQWRNRLCKDLCSALDLMLFWYSGAHENKRGGGRSGGLFKELKSFLSRALWATASSYKIPASCRLYRRLPLPSAFFVRNDYRSPVHAQQRLHPESTHPASHLVCWI